jgi:hypothetical protein
VFASLQGVGRSGRRAGEFKFEDRRALHTRYVDVMGGGSTPPATSPLAQLLPIQPAVPATTGLFMPGRGSSDGKQEA